MGVSNFEGLKDHVGHSIVCVAYGDPRDPHNVAVECETCGEVLIDFDNPKIEGRMRTITRVEFAMWKDGVEDNTTYVIDYANQADLDKQLSKLHERLDALYDEVEYRGPVR